MSSNYELSTQSRDSFGTGASRRQRRENLVPAVVYGAGKDNESVMLDHDQVMHSLEKEAFHSAIIDLKTDKGSQQVILREVQMHPHRQLVMHVDFQRVSAKEKITMRVPLHFTNEENAPSVKLGGGVVNRIESEVEVSCLPGNLPEYIEVDCGALEIGDSIHLSQLNLPEGVESAHLIRGGEDLGVVAIQKARGPAADEDGSSADDSEGGEETAAEESEDKGESSEA